MKLRLAGIKMPIQLKTAIPGPRSIALMAERRQHVAKGPFHTTPVFMAQAKGALIEDVDGNTLIDFASGIGVVNVGHAPEPVLSAIHGAAQKVLHAGFNVTPYEGYIRLAQALNEIVPGEFTKKTLLINSGAEAVENAIKIARAYTRRQAVVCFDHGFHGRTYMAMTLTSKAKPYKVDFGPFNPEVYRAPFPYAYRWPTGSDPTRVSEECFMRFREIVETQIGADHVAAVMIEPVLGEGGFIPVPRQFWLKLREYCTQHRIVLIADEIQSGFGRTGTLFATEQLGAPADLMTLAKGLGAGMPIAAVTGRAEIMDGTVEGGVGGTYGGNPVACASALAVIEMFRKGEILSHSRAIGEKLHARLKKWQAEFSIIGDVRGLGAMLGMELVKDRATQEPHREATAALIKYAYEHGVVTLSSGTNGNVVRFLMPLVIEPSDLEAGLNVLEEGLRSLKT
ncbi:MAG: 4-aminobutyrate--2-oxoglutarate transaminase [Oligoflexia bacterium]